MSAIKSDANSATSGRSMLNTTIDRETFNAFKAYCKERGYKMNMILESFMRQFAAGEFILKIGKSNRLYVDVEEE